MNDLVRHSCDLCNRDGDLVCQTVEPKPANSYPSRYPEDHTGPWVFRYYMCRWHRGAWNRTRTNSQGKLTVLEYIDDSTLLNKYEETIENKARKNLERGGEAFHKYVCKLIKDNHWDSANTDIKLMSDDRIYNLWKNKGNS